MASKVLLFATALLGLALHSNGFGVAAANKHHISWPWSKPVKVQVLYEALSRESLLFITNQLTPTFKKLGSGRMTVDFVPHGFSKLTGLDANGYSVFRCEHEGECFANTLMACGLSRLHGDNAKQVQLINCIMSAKRPENPDDRCFLDAGLDPEEVKPCVKNPEGWGLQKEMSERTPTNMTSVPTLYFDGLFNPVDQGEAMTDLRRVVCRKLPRVQRLFVC